eukprot:gene23745-9303_t
MASPDDLEALDMARRKVEALAAEVPEDFRYDEVGYVSMVEEKKKTSKVEAMAAELPEDVWYDEEGYVSMVEEKKIT